MSRRARWLTAIFLALTAAAVGWEIWAAADGDPDTWTWTQLITTYVPAPLTYALVAALAAWLPAHFAYYYQRRARLAETALRAAADRAEAALRAAHPVAVERPYLAVAIRRAIERTGGSP